MLVADVSFMIALTDAIVEPLANAVWYFLLDKFWASKNKKLNNPHKLSFFSHPLYLSDFALHQYSTFDDFYKSTFLKYSYRLGINGWFFKHY